MNSQNNSTKNPWVTVIILVISAFLSIFNETSVNVCLIPIAEDMNVATETVQWLITGYMLVTAIMVPITAFLYQSIPTKRIYQIAMGIVFVGTIGCFASINFPMMLILRMFQAIGTGMMIPIMMNTTLIVAPKEKIGTAMGLCIMGITLGPALGPTIAGILTQLFNWRATFLAISICVLVLFILGSISVDNVAQLSHPKLDVLSVILSVAGLGAFLYGVSAILKSPLIGAICIVIGIIILIFFVIRQNKLEEPMLNFAPFKNKVFTYGLIIASMNMFIVFSTNVLMPSFLQEAKGAASSISAIVMLPGVLLSTVATAISGKLLDKRGPRKMIPLGFMGITIMLLIQGFFGVNYSILIVAICYALLYIGLGFSMSPSQTSALAVLPKELNPHGVSLINTVMQIAASLSSALFGAITAAVSNSALASGVSVETAATQGFGTCMIVAGGFAFATFIITILFARAHKKETMQ